MALTGRRIAKFHGAPGGMRDGDLARELGVSPWGVKDVRSQAKRWDPASIAEALRLVAVADADIKGQASDPSYTLERLVLTISQMASGSRR
jgi:DNA polymerase-3 subunit delta